MGRSPSSAALLPLTVSLLLFAIACRSESTGVPPPQQQSSTPTPRNWTTLTPEEAVAAVQRVPGAKAFGLGVESPESVRQEVRDSAQVQMILNNERMNMIFERHGQQWDWVATTSPLWPGQRKTPSEIVSWLAAHAPR